MDKQTKSRLLEIRNEIENLTDELKTILRCDCENKPAYDRANAYGLAYLEYAIVGDGIRGSFSSINDTLRELGIDPAADPGDMVDDEIEDDEDLDEETQEENFRKSEKCL